MSKPVIPVEDLLALTKKLATASRQCHVPHDGGFERCSRLLDALHAHPSSPCLKEDSAGLMLAAARLGFEAAADGRHGHFHVAAALYRIGSAWQETGATSSRAARAILRSLNDATRHFVAAEPLISCPDQVALDADGNCSFVHRSVAPFLAGSQNIRVPKATQLRAELHLATRQVAKTCGRCSCKDDDCLRSYSRHFRTLLTSRSDAEAYPEVIDVHLVHTGFFALLDGCDAHFHLTVSCRLLVCAWKLANPDGENLVSAGKKVEAALDHLRQVNLSLMKMECNRS